MVLCCRRDLDSIGPKKEVGETRFLGFLTDREKGSAWTVCFVKLRTQIAFGYGGKPEVLCPIAWLYSLCKISHHVRPIAGTGVNDRVGLVFFVRL